MVVEEDGVRSPVEKFLSPEEIAGVLEATGASPGDLVLIVADRADRVAVALDGLRRTMAARLEPDPRGRVAFLWVTEPPLFEWSDEEQRWASLHHPFTAPLTRRPGTGDREGARVRHRPERLRAGQRQHPDPPSRPAAQGVRGAWGSRPRRSTSKFGHLIKAFRYGVAAARGHRVRARPARDAADRQGGDPRRDRLPEDAVGRRSAHRRAGARLGRASSGTSGLRYPRLRATEGGELTRGPISPSTTSHC